MTQTKDELFDEKNEVKSNWWVKGKPGDWVKGTLVDVREMESQLPGQTGKMVKIYEFLTSGGSFHRLDDNKQPITPAVEIMEGEYWMIGGNQSLDNQMRNMKKGQIVGIRFTETKPAKQKGFNPSKVLKVYDGGMDPNYMGQTSADQEYEEM